MATSEGYAPAAVDRYVWWFPGSPLKVHLALDLVRRLSQQLQLAGPDAVREGLLFGKTLEGATEVLDFEPAPGRVPETVSTLAKDGARQLLVGYYRIDTGNALRLKESDLALARTCFGQPYHVFLIIQQTGFGPPNASFFFHENDGKMAEFSLMEFPFEPSLLAGEERDRLKRSQDAAARRSAAIQPPLDAHPPRSTRRIVVPLVLLSALLLCGAAIFAANRLVQAWRPRTPAARVDPAVPAPRSAPAPPVVAMGLRAKKQNADVEITWNRESPVILAATSAVLSIQDGRSRRDINLDVPQLRNSSVLYSPVSNNVSIQLSVTVSVSTVTESVMLLLPNNQPAKLYTVPIPETPGTRPLK